MVNGRDQGHHHKHGSKMETNGTVGRKIVARLVSIGPLEVDTTDEYLTMITGRRPHRPREESDGQIGVMVLILDTVTSLHHLAMAATHCQLYHVTVLMQAAIDGGHLQLAMYTFQPTKEVHDDHANQMSGSAMAPVILATRETARQTTGQTGTEVIAIGIEGIGQVIREALAENGEMAEQGREVQSGVTGTATPGMTTSIVGGDAY
jgi:hypothetical protein